MSASCVSDRISEARARLRVEGASGETMATIDSLLRQAPASPELWILRAEALAARGDEAEARASLERALALDPSGEAARRIGELDRKQ
jgi:Flp pilus assembly protein TadD